MKSDYTKSRICPYCNSEYSERPALSRLDNDTLICPDCGTRQALETLGISVSEQDKIIEAIHKSYTGD